MDSTEPAALGSDPIAVRTRPLSRLGFPLLVEAQPGADSLPGILDWIDRNRAALREQLLHHGGILFRGFSAVRSVAEFEQVVDAVCPELLPYVGGTTSREPLHGKIATASGARYQGTIPVHQEMSYQESFPSHLMFYCQQPARSGGQTRVASARAFRSALPRKVWDAFVAHGVKTFRTLSPRDAPWSTWRGRPWNLALLADSRPEAERIMQERGWCYEWTCDGGLAIEQPSLPATRIHPQTGEEVWFNQCHVNNPLMIRTALLADRHFLSWFTTIVAQSFTRGRNYPTQTRFGDGSPIPPRYLRAVQRSLDTVTVAIDWQARDFLILDNYLMLHGRSGFTGERVIGAALLTHGF